MPLRGRGESAAAGAAEPPLRVPLRLLGARSVGTRERLGQPHRRDPVRASPSRPRTCSRAISSRARMSAAASIPRRHELRLCGADLDLRLTPQFSSRAPFGGAIHNGDTQPIRAAPEPVTRSAARPLFREAGSVGVRLSANWSMMATVEHMSNGGVCAAEPRPDECRRAPWLCVLTERPRPEGLPHGRGPEPHLHPHGRQGHDGARHRRAPAEIRSAHRGLRHRRRDQCLPRPRPPAHRRACGRRDARAHPERPLRPRRRPRDAGNAASPCPTSRSASSTPRSSGSSGEIDALNEPTRRPCAPSSCRAARRPRRRCTSPAPSAAGPSG